MNEGKPKVFISHSWEDNEISRKLADNLRRDGAEVWIDTSRIVGGDSLPDAIGEGIEWCDVFLLVWSKSAKNSYYVKLERNCAVDNRKRIIPCVIDNEKVPTILTAFLRIDFNKFEQGYNNLKRDLKLTIIQQEIKVTPAKKAVLKPEIVKSKTTIFRSSAKELSKDAVKRMLKKYEFYCREYNWNKDFCNPTGKGFNNQYEVKTISGDKLVYDRASDLMWQQSGSSKNMKFKGVFKDAKKWIIELNQEGYAGYYDWRLPTLEEAMSLMEPKEKNDDLYIDPVFDSNQRWIWTADQVQEGSRAAWVVDFSFGRCGWLYFLHYGYVRSVRSGQSASAD